MRAIAALALLFIVSTAAADQPAGYTRGPAPAPAGSSLRSFEQADSGENQPVLRLGLVSFGTASWEIDTLRRHGLDRGFALSTVELADPAAGEIALQAGGVDAIVTDWLWVSRQRHAGQRIVFVPHSSALGEIMIRADSPVHSLADLSGKRLGIAGGPLDKSWLLLRAYSRRQSGRDIADQVEPAFAAPPLLSQELARGRVDAVLTFWPYAARLEAAGNRSVVSMAAVMDGLGFPAPVPMIGFAFSETWVRAHPEAARLFLAAIDAADRLMAEQAEWDKLKPLIGTADPATLEALRRRFSAGLLTESSASAGEAARLYSVLAEVGGTGLTGGASGIAPGTFWSGAE